MFETCLNIPKSFLSGACASQPKARTSCATPAGWRQGIEERFRCAAGEDKACKPQIPSQTVGVLPDIVGNLYWENLFGFWGHVENKFSKTLINVYGT